MNDFGQVKPSSRGVRARAFAHASRAFERRRTLARGTPVSMVAVAFVVVVVVVVVVIRRAR